MSEFKLVSEFEPKGDQPQAIDKLTEGVLSGMRYQTLLGVTGSGKTFTMANVIARVGRPTLVISHNKTLAAQLYTEFKHFFPYNAVEYFVSYYDYYQPEAYVPQTDTYIEKEASINEEIERLRLSATSALLERRDVIIVASVSCIFSIGSPEEHRKLCLVLEVGEKIRQEDILLQLVNMQYERNDYDFSRGTFRVRGDVIEVFPAYSENAVRIEMFGNEIEKICDINPLTGTKITDKERAAIYPAKHFVTTQERLEAAIKSIELELEFRVEELKKQGKLLEAQRLYTRTKYDIEMLREVGYCQGVENYSRHLDGRKPGEPPYTLLDYFPEDFLLFIDESHVTIPQLRGMYWGDRSRKETLVEHGFRLPSALDNRPLSFEEFEERVGQMIFVSATPGPYELEHSEQVVEQLIRPTGLIDPKIVVKPTQGQIDDLIGEINKRVDKGQRVLVTTLTKRMAEDLAEYLQSMGLRVTYLHSEIDTLDRVEILRDLRMGKFDCIVGINLLREGLDLPEVSLVAILDADKEGFLRSATSLIQIAGRAARNVDGEVILYADTITESMKKAIEETERRRAAQMKYNEEHGITPESIQKTIENMIETRIKAKNFVDKIASSTFERKLAGYQIPEEASIEELRQEMFEAAKRLEFEKAALLRDRIIALEEKKTQTRTRKKRTKYRRRRRR